MVRGFKTGERQMGSSKKITSDLRENMQDCWIIIRRDDIIKK